MRHLMLCTTNRNACMMTTSSDHTRPCSIELGRDSNQGWPEFCVVSFTGDPPCLNGYCYSQICSCRPYYTGAYCEVGMFLSTIKYTSIAIQTIQCVQCIVLSSSSNLGIIWCPWKYFVMLLPVHATILCYTCRTLPLTSNAALCPEGGYVCNNGGRCSGDSQATCDCPPGYGGDFCQELVITNDTCEFTATLWLK